MCEDYTGLIEYTDRHFGQSVGFAPLCHLATVAGLSNCTKHCHFCCAWRKRNASGQRAESSQPADWRLIRLTAVSVAARPPNPRWQPHPDFLTLATAHTDTDTDTETDADTGTHTLIQTQPQPHTWRQWPRWVEIVYTYRMKLLDSSCWWWCCW